MRGSPRVLLIDNIDSFTFNVADLLHRSTGVAPTVWRHDHHVDREPDVDRDLRKAWWQAFDAIVVGPGPGSPMVAGDMGISREALAQQDVPVLGVCLGHQGIAYRAGHLVQGMSDPMHGRVSLVQHDGTGLFAGIPSPFEVVRYHSLAVDLAGARSGEGVPLRGCAWAQDDGALMALHDPASQRWGVQFHPESVLTDHGQRLMTNFFAEAGVALPVPATRTPSEAEGEKSRPATNAVEMELTARRFNGGVDAWALHEALARLRGDDLRRDDLRRDARRREDVGDGGVRESVWLDSSDHVGLSVFADAAGPGAYTLTHRVERGSELSTGEHLDGFLLDNLDTLSARIAHTEETGLDLPFDFRPGFVGYFGYELKAETGGRAAHRSPRPDAWLIFADRAVVIEHATEAVYAVALHTAATHAKQQDWFGRVEAVVEQLRLDRDATVVAPAPAPAPALAAAPAPAPTPAAAPALAAAAPTRVGDDVVAESGRHTRPEYEALISRAQDFIRAGETYEVCLTNEVTWPDEVDEVRAYAALRSFSPVPHGAWLRCGSFSVLSASPERFVSLSAAGTVTAEPIKGTRARAADPGRDTAVVRELATDSKELAENLMIVDLLRNDLHRVCRAGSVEVPEMFAVRTWSTVHQLVSTITGQASDGVGPTQVLRSAFPGGSMTGAPKVRTMQIMDDLEAGPRGVYAGAIGWLGVNKAMDTSIVIRTVVIAESSTDRESSSCRATFGIGGAITVLSNPGDEYDETLIKARGVASALVVAGAVQGDTSATRCM